MKIFFGVPEKYSLDALYPPTALLYLAAIARNLGHIPCVVDGQIVGNQVVLKEFSKVDYDYFGASLLSPLRENTYTLIRQIKSINPRCKIIVGGAHISLLPEQTLDHVPEIDIAVIGEGEETLGDILSGRDLSQISGIYYRQSGHILKTPKRPPMDPKNIPMPAYDLIDINKYRAYEDLTIDGVPFANKPFLTIYSSRGCTGSCSFCSTWHIWGKWRQITPARFVDEIEYLYNKGIQHFFIADDSMINTEDFVHGFAQELANRNISIKYKIACRADKTTPAIVSSLKRSGCYEVHVGFESGSQKILDSIGKNEDIETNIRAADLLHDAGLRVYALIIIGAVEETIESVNETITFLKRIKPDVVASMGGLMLLPGTRDYLKASFEGVVSDNYWIGKEPFLFYTKHFSHVELRLLWFAVQQRTYVWPRPFFHLQFILFYPFQYLSATKPQWVSFMKRLFFRNNSSIISRTNK